MFHPNNKMWNSVQFLELELQFSSQISILQTKQTLMEILGSMSLTRLLCHLYRGILTVLIYGIKSPIDE